jgi:hypothetical protein
VTADTMLEAALAYVREGVPVFPLGGKNPFKGTHGFKDATTDESVVRRMWKEHPGANIGMPTGEKSGVFVLDPDGPRGAESLATLEAKHKPLPETHEVRTGRSDGGRHLYFHQPADVKTKSGNSLLGPKLDVKGDGGYVVLPPSIHPDSKLLYTLVNDGGPAQAPAWLLTLVRDDAPKRTPLTASSTGPKIPYGQHDSELTSIAGKLRRDGLEEKAIENALVEVCEKRCENYGRDYQKMCAKIARSVCRYEPGRGDWPEVTETLEQFNKQFYVVEDLGGKCRVCSEKPSSVFASAIDFTHQSFEDFRNRFHHQLIKVGEDAKGNPVYQDRGRVWLHHKDRRQYSQIIYAPEQKLPADVRNLWRGFAYEPKKGDCSHYLAHLLVNVCQENPTRYAWLTGWMAYAVRHPNEQGHTCPVLVGGQGVGKNSATDPFAHLWGAHYRIITQRSHFTGHFNAHLRDCSVLVVNEAFFAGDRSQAGPMKGLITDSFLAIEAKGIDVVNARNLLHVIIVSNEDWVVPADMDSRRFTVFTVSDAHKEDTAYFGAMHAQLANGGYEALLYHLLNDVDICNFDPRKILVTDELQEQKTYSLHGVESVWFECLQRGSLPGKINDGGSATLRASDLVDWAAKKQLRGWDGLRTEHVGHLLSVNRRGKKKGMDFQKTRPSGVFGEGQVRVWQIPPLSEAREAWDEKRFAVDWGNEEGNWKIDKDWAGGRS